MQQLTEELAYLHQAHALCQALSNSLAASLVCLLSTPAEVKPVVLNGHECCIPLSKSGLLQPLFSQALQAAVRMMHLL